MKIASIALLGVGISLSAAANPPHPRYDGHWWQQGDEGERTGFLYGLEDCYAIDGTPKMIFEDNWAAYRKNIDGVYATPSRLGEPVAQVFRQLGRKQNEEEHAGMAQEQRYGSEFWRGSSEPARRGFLEAYITCPPHPRRKLSLARLDQYVARLNDMYNVGDKRGEDAPAFAGPVADALELSGK
ncbi:MAG TPA: hypothetical protein VF472_03675 [Burkholderiaceae bacterium]